MKKIMNVILALAMSMTCFVSNLSALEVDYETIPYTLGEELTISSINNNEDVYSFTLEEDGVVDVLVDFDFEDEDEKTVMVSLINEEVIQAFFDMLVGKEVDLSGYYNYADEKTLKATSYQSHLRYQMEAGTYYFTISADGYYDVENDREIPVVGSAKARLSLYEDEVQINHVNFSYKKSLWMDVPQPRVITTVDGFKAPIPYMDDTVGLEPIRAGYYLDGFYAYRKRDHAWLYAEEIEIYDEVYEEYFYEYDNYGWYPLGSAPENYVRYTIYYESFGDAIYQMETMKDQDEVILREVWSPNEYIIRYHANRGGQGTMKNSYFIYNKTKKLRANTYTHKTKDFKGWKAKYTDWWEEVDYWYYTDGSECGWYPSGEQPEGWTKYIFQNQEKVKNLVDDYNVIHMYAVWR